MARRYYYGHKHNWDTTQNIGALTPTFYKFHTPLDTWGGKQTVIARMSPLDKPVFGEFYYDQYLFACDLVDLWSKENGFSTNFKDVSMSVKDTGRS